MKPLTRERIYFSTFINFKPFRNPSVITVTPISIFSDNYIWLITHQHDRSCFAVDPGSAHELLAYIQHHDLNLLGILITHHHLDHTGGLEKLSFTYPGLTVYAPELSNINGVTNPVADGESITLFEQLNMQIIAVPGHTLDHIAYFCPENSIDNWQNMLFCGDTLFAGGCGKNFEGPSSQLWRSLKKLSMLPENTLIYCAHEYTLSNLDFACRVEPENTALRERLRAVTQMRKKGEITLPSVMKLEKETNPFLRVHLESVRNGLSTQVQCPYYIDEGDEVVFEALRNLKNNYPA